MKIMESSEFGHLRKLAEVGKCTSQLLHEINNNFTIIIGLLDLIDYKYSNIEPPLKEYLDKIYEYVDKSVKLAENTLIKAKKDHNLLPFSEINKTIRNTINSIKHTKRYRNIEIELDLENAPCKVFINATDLEHVLVNLIKNANDAILSACEKGNIIIKTFMSGEYAFIEIADSGPGIPFIIHDKIFEPFFTTKINKKGTGVGLNICKQIISNYNGEIFLDKSYTKGAKFVIKLPIQ